MMLARYLPVLFRNYGHYSSVQPVKANRIFNKTYITYKHKINTSLSPKMCPLKLKLFCCRGYFTFSASYKKILLISAVKCQISSRRSIHPIFWVVLRPLLKIVAFLTGRGFRKWWQNLPPNKKQFFLDLLRKNTVKISGAVSFLVLLAFMYYLSHLQEAPITKRRRFMAFNAKQFKQIGDIEFKKMCLMYEALFLPPNHSANRRVAAVVHQLLAANKDVPEIYDKTWTIAVVNDETENAFVLPNGQIFVFGGMLKLCTNDDQLGAILAHEMSHCILGHAAENFSVVHLLDCAMIIVIAAVWAIIPSDLLALFTQWLIKKIVDIVLELPYSRRIEIEADEVGLTLAAKACFDVRESSAFWAKMALIQHGVKEIPDVEFLSTHPSHEKRSHHLDNLMAEAIQLRSDCGCPKLKTFDPRINIEFLAKRLDEARRQYKVHRPIAVPIPT